MKRLNLIPFTVGLLFLLSLAVVGCGEPSPNALPVGQERPNDTFAKARAQRRQAEQQQTSP